MALETRKPINYIDLSWYLLLIVPLVITLINLPSSSYEIFTVLSLVILLNAQARKYYFLKKLKLLSTIIEIFMFLLLNHFYICYTYILFFAALVDISMNFQDEALPLAVFTGIGLLLSLLPMADKSLLIVVPLLFTAVFMLLQQLRGELIKRRDTEVLYDQIRKYNYELESARRRLLDYSSQVEKIAQLEERNRISRELHDAIGHNLTAVLLQVDACMSIIGIDKEKGMRLLHSVYKNINASIEAVRQTVRKLRPRHYQTSLQSIQELITNFQAETGTSIELKTRGDAYEIPATIETILYSNIQEAITNSVRHGSSKHIQIQLLYKQSHIEVYIYDDGIGAAPIKKGFGMSGMEERVSLIGGTISYSGSNGFHIHMTLPKGVE